jgi:hypothetical protein
MNKLATFVERMYYQGVKQANVASMAARAIPRTRAGRVGLAAGLGGLGLAALSPKEEPSFSDKALQYMQGIDPQSINAAMSMYSQVANPHASMGYDPLDQSEEYYDMPHSEEYSDE